MYVSTDKNILNLIHFYLCKLAAAVSRYQKSIKCASANILYSLYIICNNAELTPLHRYNHYKACDEARILATLINK